MEKSPTLSTERTGSDSPVYLLESGVRTLSMGVSDQDELPWFPELYKVLSRVVEGSSGRKSSGLVPVSDGLAARVGESIGMFYYEREFPLMDVAVISRKCWDRLVDAYFHGRYIRKGPHYDIVIEAAKHRYQNLIKENRVVCPRSCIYAGVDGHESRKVIIWDDDNLFINITAFYSWCISVNFPVSLIEKAQFVTGIDREGDAVIPRIEIIAVTDEAVSSILGSLKSCLPPEYVPRVKLGRTFSRRERDRSIPDRVSDSPRAPSPVGTCPQADRFLNQFEALRLLEEEEESSPAEDFIPLSVPPSQRKRNVVPVGKPIRPIKVSVGTFNANGIRDKELEVNDVLQSRGIDVLAVQETKLGDNSVAKFSNYIWKGRNFDLREKGLGFAISHRLVKYVSVLPYPSEKCIMAIRLDLPGNEPFFIINCYVSPSLEAKKAKDFFLSLSELWDSYVLEGKVLILGDFNCPFNSNYERIRTEGVCGKIISNKLIKFLKDRGVNVLNPLLESASSDGELDDPDSSSVGVKFRPTHFKSNRPTWSDCCLDYAFSSFVGEKFSTSDVPDASSDHAMLWGFILASLQVKIALYAQQHHNF